MKTVTKYIREHLWRLIERHSLHKVPDLALLEKLQWDPEFENWQRNRLIMASFRYNTFEENEQQKGKHYFIEAAYDKLSLYQRTGNIEHLVDLANYCMLEKCFGNHPKKHFRAQDDSAHCRKRK
jgi:hypothetical protein